MKNKCKKIMSLVLTALMLISCLPAGIVLPAEAAAVSGTIAGKQEITEVSSLTSGSEYLIKTADGTKRLSDTLSGGALSLDTSDVPCWTLEGNTLINSRGEGLRINRSSLAFSSSGHALTISYSAGNGGFEIKRSGGFREYFLDVQGSGAVASRSGGTYWKFYEVNNTPEKTVDFTLEAPFAPMTAGDSLSLSYSVKKDGVQCSDNVIEWTSSSGAVSVSDGVITAVSPGTAEITALLTAAGGEALDTALRLSITAEVKAPEKQYELILTPASLTLTEGQTADITAEVKIDGVITDNYVIEWESSAPEKAEVSSGGRVTAKSPGYAAIKARITGAGNEVPAVPVEKTVQVTVKSTSVPEPSDPALPDPNTAYSTVFSASDLQTSEGNTYLREMLSQAKADGITSPDGFVLGGDYSGESHAMDPAPYVEAINTEIKAVYPDMNRQNILYVQGNHDLPNADVIPATGLHETEHYWVYVLNEDNFTQMQDTQANAQEISAEAQIMADALETLVASGDRRPVYVCTHLPLHHNSRHNYGDNLYSKYIFDTLNYYGSSLDIIFLFGHNHSDKYDDYIGGSVNYIEKGSEIRIPVPDIAQMGPEGYTYETLNFTYMNCGYPAYSGNSVTETSTNKLTVSAISLYPDRIEVKRYARDGLYGDTKVIDRVRPLTDEPYAKINGVNSGEAGSSVLLKADYYNFTDPVVSWEVLDGNSSAAPSGDYASVYLKNQGETVIRLTVSDARHSVSDTLTLNITEKTSPMSASIYINGENAGGTSREYLKTLPGDTFMYEGKFAGFGPDAVISWSSSEPRVATVSDGLVTVTGSGETVISFTVSENGQTRSSEVSLFITSSRHRGGNRYAMTDALTEGYYVIANMGVAGGAEIMTDSIVEITNPDSYFSDRIEGAGVNITDENGELIIYSDAKNTVWKTEDAGGGSFYLKNTGSGGYLRSLKENGTERKLSLPYDRNLSGTKWRIDSATGHLINDVGYSVSYSGSSKLFRAEDSVPHSECVLYRRTAGTPAVKIEHRGADISGTQQYIYNVIPGRSLDLHGEFYDFSGVITTEWSSDNTAAAGIENGKLVFTGEEGVVNITCTVSDTDGHSAAETVTFNISRSGEPKKIFKLTDTFVTGKKYLIAARNKTGATYIMTDKPCTSNQRLSRKYAVVEPDTSDGIVYIEVPLNSTEEVWICEESGTPGYVRLKNEKNQQYLYLETSGVLGTADMAEEPGSIWKIQPDGLYSSLNESTTNINYGVHYSSGGNFRCSRPAESEKSEIFIYEESVLRESAHIRSRFVNIEGSSVSRQEICKYQTEKLEPVAVNFPDNSSVSFTWSSDNPGVASIDASTGVITYTGVPGEVNITLNAVSQTADASGNYPGAQVSTLIRVEDEQGPGISGKYYLTSDFSEGNMFIIAAGNLGPVSALGNESYFGSSGNEIRMYELPAEVIEGEQGLYIMTDNENMVWECLPSGVPGRVHLKNKATGEYLALVDDPSLNDAHSPKNERIITSPGLDEYAPEAYLIDYVPDTGVIRSDQAGNLQCNPDRRARFRFTGGSTNTHMYLYSFSGTDVSVKPEISIRENDYFGTKDITNVLQNRYNVTAGTSEQLLCHTKGIYDISEITWTSDNENIASADSEGRLTFTGIEGFVSVSLTVKGVDGSGNPVEKTVRTTFNPFAGDRTEPTENYPEYPHEGSVKVDKTASGRAGGYDFGTSGVTEVELSVKGVPMTQPVDVVIVFDHSSSMNDNNKLKNAIADTRDFALQLVNSHPSNRLALVTFDRFREAFGNLADPVPDDSSAPNSTEDRIVTGTGTPEGAFVGIAEEEKLIAQIDSLQYNATAGTNYDFGLKTCYQILEASKTDPKANKNQFVIFMSDGRPYLYNRLIISYNQPGQPYEAWLTGDETNAELKKYLDAPSTYPAAEYFNTDGNNWFAEALKAPVGADVILPSGDYYDGFRKGLGANIFTIGYDAGEPGSLTSDILSRMATYPENFYYAKNDLQPAYDKILNSIVYAANRAVVKDKMGGKFRLQTAPSYTLGNGAATINLDPAPYIELGSWSINSDGTRGEYEVIENITFEYSPEGVMTGAYSDKLPGENIYDAASGKITGRSVSYDLITEEFTWRIGDIGKRDATLKYYAYLEGSAEGEREAGLYETNEKAVLDYYNYRGEKCEQTFPVPSLGWKQAAVSYEFYLVNEAGQPVNTDGVAVPFSERIVIGNEQTKDIFLNTSDAVSAYKLKASSEVPDGYTLYNENAAYDVVVSSGSNPGSASVTDEGAPVITTYVREGNNYYCRNGQIDEITDFTNTHVSFAVVLKAGIIPDTVVIDYGLPVKISVLNNDSMAGKDGSLTKLYVSLPGNTVLNSHAYTVSAEGGSSEIILDNGRAEISDRVIIYTPTDALMDKEEVFFYEYKTADGRYFYTSVTVIPAANIYYEESFFNFADGDGYHWQTAGDTVPEAFQSEDRPGSFNKDFVDADNVYGYDDVNSSSYTYSLGSAKYTFVDSNSYSKEPYAEFSFCGTGFDLFSITSDDTGAVLVSVYLPDGSLYKNYIVQTYYGYTQDEQGNFIPAPGSGGCLYQVPVISAKNLGYNKYRVVVKPIYSSMFDPSYDNTGAGDNSYGIYIDSVRIYDPAGIAPPGDSVIGDAYVKDGEYAPYYEELRNNMIDSEEYYSSFENPAGNTYISGAVMIDGNSALDGVNGITDDFKNAGPNNEVYLKKGQAVAFILSASSDLSLASLQLGMKVINGNTAELLIMNSSDGENEKLALSGAHEMFRPLDSVITWDTVKTEQGIYETKYPVILANVSENDAVISLTRFKLSHKSADVQPVKFMLKTTAQMPRAALMSLRAAQAPPAETPAEAYWEKDSVIKGGQAVLYVKTSFETAKVTVGGNILRECEVSPDGTKTWIFRYSPAGTGTDVFEINLYGRDGSLNESLFSPELKVKKQMNVFEKIMDMFRRILDFIRGIFR